MDCTRKRTPKHRTEETIRIIMEYSAAHGRELEIEEISPGCLRVFRKIKAWGKCYEKASQREYTPSKWYYTGARVGIVDFYPKTMKYHDLTGNMRGVVSKPYKKQIFNILTTPNDDNKNSL